MNYYDYFPDEDVPMDEFIAEATRTDIRFQTLAEELQFLRTARVTLNNELFTCYEYLRERGLLELYQATTAIKILLFDKNCHIWILPFLFLVAEFVFLFNSIV